MYVIAAYIVAGVWVLLGIVAVCACVAGGRAEARWRAWRRARSGVEAKRRGLRAAMF